MKGIKLLTIVGTVLAAGTIAATPMIASADADVDAAVFVGNTTNLTPDVQLVGGSGLFGFSTTNQNPVPTACVGVSSDDTPPVGLCSVTASGSYTNIVCGTGSAVGTAATTETAVVGGPGGGTDSVGFSITFVAGVGVVTGGADGVVVLLPTSPASNPNCVSGFTVVGVNVIP